MTKTRFAMAALATAVAISPAAFAQQVLPPMGRTAPARPPAAAPKPPGAPVAAAPSRSAAACHNGASFDRFLADLKQQAIAQGVSQRAIAKPRPTSSTTRASSIATAASACSARSSPNLPGAWRQTTACSSGQAHIRQYQAAFARAEKEYGVPPAVIAAFWGLESDFGANMGNLPTLPSLVSLAYDCRRSEHVPGRDHRRAEDRRSRRSFARRDDRLLGRRTRPDPIPADALLQLRRRL